MVMAAAAVAVMMEMTAIAVKKGSGYSDGGKNHWSLLLDPFRLGWLSSALQLRSVHRQGRRGAVGQRRE